MKKYRDFFRQLPLKSLQNVAAVVLASHLFAVGELPQSRF